MTKVFKTTNGKTCEAVRTGENQIKTDGSMGYNRQQSKMRKVFFILLAISCLRISANTPPLTPNPAVTAAASVGINATIELKHLTSTEYYLKITVSNSSAYYSVSSCQMALEKTYDLLKSGKVDEVRIVSDSFTFNGSCRNVTYTKYQIDEVKKRRDSTWLERR